MMKYRSERGFTIVEISVVVLVLGLLSFVGLRAWGSYEAQKLASTQTTQSTPREMVAISSSKDLDELSSQLDEIDVVGEFEAQLDTATTF